LILSCLVALTPRIAAQAQEVTIQSGGKTVRVCKSADLDSSVSFVAGPDSYFIVAVNMQNISQNPCAPQPSPGLPIFAHEQGQEIKPFGLCIDCEDRLPNGQYRTHDPSVLNAGQIGHQTYRWKTIASADSVKCLRVSALFTPVLISTPTLFQPVCSEIEVSHTYADAYETAAEKGEGVGELEESSDEAFILTTGKTSYLDHESFNLHVSVADRGALTALGEDCPTFFLRQRSPDGTTRLDEEPPNGFKTCKSFSLGADRSADWQSGFEIWSGMSSRWGGTGEHSFELFRAVAVSQHGRIRFVHSNRLTVRIEDPALISRKWAGKSKGLGLDVTLDKEDYKIGEDVPLHVGIENFAALVPIYATSPVWDPYGAIGIEVRDERGRLLPQNERFAATTIWMGHGRGPEPFPVKRFVPIERTLASQGWLPLQAGRYTVLITWSSVEGPPYQSGFSEGIFPVNAIGNGFRDVFKPYATVQAAASFRIVEERSPTPTHDF